MCPGVDDLGVAPSARPQGGFEVGLLDRHGATVEDGVSPARVLAPVEQHVVCGLGTGIGLET